MSLADPWIRAGLVERVLDGDTVRVLVDLGYRVHYRATIRIVGINAPEVVGARRAEGLAARDRVLELAPVGSPVVVWTTGPDKYGDRWVGSVVLPDGRSVGVVLLEEGLAEPYPVR